MNTKLKTVKLVDIECCTCGIDFSMPHWLNQRRIEDGGTFWCPAGHAQSYTEPEVVRLRKQIDRLKTQNIHLADQRTAADRAAAAYKGQVTRLRKRVSNGVCPCCNRTFANLGRHMETKHPGYAGTPESAGGEATR